MDKYSKICYVHIMFSEKFRKSEKPNYCFVCGLFSVSCTFASSTIQDIGKNVYRLVKLNLGFIEKNKWLVTLSTKGAIYVFIFVCGIEERHEKKLKPFCILKSGIRSLKCISCTACNFNYH